MGQSKEVQDNNHDNNHIDDLDNDVDNSAPSNNDSPPIHHHHFESFYFDDSHVDYNLDYAAADHYDQHPAAAILHHAHNGPHHNNHPACVDNDCPHHEFDRALRRGLRH